MASIANSIREMFKQDYVYKLKKHKRELSLAILNDEDTRLLRMKIKVIENNIFRNVTNDGGPR